MQRRRFLIAGSAATLSAGLALWYRARGSAPPDLPSNSLLVRDKDRVLDLPKGFSYRVVERTGERMDDGYRVPGRPDAMGCFDLGDGRWALMRNHELDRSTLTMGPYGLTAKAPEEAYDALSMGGVTRVLLDQQGRRLRSNLVLVGTSRNCAGGMSPWGWLTCEENVDSGHGYVFLCSTRAQHVRRPHRISAYGRFLHEAVAIDPANHAAYLTEDRIDSCLYRYLPKNREEPFGAGSLQALAVKDQPRFELGAEQPKGAHFELSWIDVPHEAGEHRDGLRHAAQELGAAIVRRGEGIWRMQDGFAFTSTVGGPVGGGQIFHLAPTPEGGTLRLLAQSSDLQTLDMPDNITLTPWGDLLVCEDNHRSAFLRLITQAGEVIPFAHNSLSRSEFAGVCFSPDGRVLFVNIQENGLTLAIEGDWSRLREART
jgi:secreted PhoX family phosphatase